MYRKFTVVLSNWCLRRARFFFLIEDGEVSGVSRFIRGDFTRGGLGFTGAPFTGVFMPLVRLMWQRERAVSVKSERRRSITVTVIIQL